MENALRTCIALPGQISIFNVRAYILFEKRKTKTTKTHNISGNRTEKIKKKKKGKATTTTKTKPRSQMHSPPPFPLLLLVLTGRCLDRGEGADGGRLVSTPPAPPEGSRLCTCWWRTQLSRLGLRSYFLKFAPYVCACLRVYISTCVCVCVCVFIHAYINIYIYVLTRISFPSGGELGGARGRLEEKLPVSAEPANWDGMGWDRQTPRLLPPRPVALFSRSPPTPRRNFLAGGEAAARQGQQQPNLEA